MIGLAWTTPSQLPEPDLRIIATYPGGTVPTPGAPLSAGVEPARAPSRGVVDVVLFLAVAALFCLSGYALERFGIPYVTVGGSTLTKIHPATYLFSAALGLAVLLHPDPIGYGISLVMRRMGAIALVVACMLIYVFVSRTKPDMSAAYVIDAMVSAGIAALALADQPATAQRRFAQFLHLIVAANAALAIIEVGSGWRLFPFGVKGQEMTWDYRATAFFGHPLDGALATGVYAVILMTKRNVLGLNERLRLPIILLCMLAMPAIGARTSFAIVYGMALVMAGFGVIAFLRGRPMNHVFVMAGLAAPAAAVMAGVAAFQLGFLDGFLSRFQDDSGSASARLELYNLFSHYELQEKIIGYDIRRLATRVRIEGLEAGVENSWVGHLLQYGIPLSAILWLALLAFLIEVLRNAGRRAILPIVFMLLILSSSVGISGKTNMLVMPVILMLVLLGGRANRAAN